VPRVWRAQAALPPPKVIAVDADHALRLQKSLSKSVQEARAMSLAGITTPNLSPLSATQDFFHQRQQDIRQLSQSLKAGDLSGAQNAYKALVALAGSRPGASASNSGSNQNLAASPFRNSQVASDFTALGQALQAGDLAGAQQAFATFRQDLNTANRAHGSDRQAGPEIIINLSGLAGSNSTQATGTSSSSNSSSATPPPADATSGTQTPAAATPSALPEIVLNFAGGNGASAGPEIILNFQGAGANGTGTTTTSSGSTGTASGSTGDVSANSSSGQNIVLNLANSGVSEIDLNLGGTNPELVLNFSGAQQSFNGKIDIVA